MHTSKLECWRFRCHVSVKCWPVEGTTLLSLHSFTSNFLYRTSSFDTSKQSLASALLWIAPLAKDPGSCNGYRTSMSGATYSMKYRKGLQCSASRMLFSLIRTPASTDLNFTGFLSKTMSLNSSWKYFFLHNFLNTLEINLLPSKLLQFALNSSRHSQFHFHIVYNNYLNFYRSEQSLNKALPKFHGHRDELRNKFKLTFSKKNKLSNLWRTFLAALPATLSDHYHMHQDPRKIAY